MRLKSYMTEKIETNVPTKIHSQKDDYMIQEFEVDGEKFKVLADLTFSHYYDDDLWMITFAPSDNPTINITSKMGTSAMKVFSGVASALKKFVTIHKPSVFEFTAKEPSRVKLYDRFADMIAKQLRYKKVKEKYGSETVYRFHY